MTSPILAASPSRKPDLPTIPEEAVPLEEPVEVMHNKSEPVSMEDIYLGEDEEQSIVLVHQTQSNQGWMEFVCGKIRGVFIRRLPSPPPA